MRLKGRQAQFLVTTLACWTAVRAWLLWPPAPDVVPPLPARRAPATIAVGSASPVAAPSEEGAQASPRTARTDIAPHGTKREAERAISVAAAEVRAPTEIEGATPSAVISTADSPAPAAPAPAALVPPLAGQARRIEAQAYLFIRPGGGTPSLAERGELGGSQIAARIAVPLNAHWAAAARVYAPIAHRGAEGAIGIDWHPLIKVPLRISVERRQRLDDAGRSAWSAYAAGGFYRGGGAGTVQVDGYGEAGVVGTARRDGFIDGALRIGYRLPVRKVAITAGAGLWGAAQPGVARLDAGPHLALTLPFDRHSLTLAVDGRLRMAGRARPGSGAALTLAADF